MRAYVTTTLQQVIEVPEGTDKQGVLNFLAEYQSFRDAFEGVSDVFDTGFRITEVQVLEEAVTELGEE
jgi:hypothetical protein